MAYEILEYFEPEVEKKLPIEQPYLDDGVRNIARTGSRVLETLGGLPKNVLGIGESVYGMLPNFISESTQKEIYPGIQKGYEYAKSFIPSSEDIRSGIGKLAPEGYLEPKTERESLADEIVSDFTSLITPIGPLKAVGPLKALGVAGASNIASYLTKNLGGSEKTQTGVKIGTTLLTSLGMGSSLKNKATQLYETARESILPGEKISATPITKALNKITKDYTSKGLSKSAGKVDVDRVVDEVSSFIHNDKIALEDLWAIKKDMNDVAAKVGYNTKGGRELKILEEEMKTVLKNSPNKAFSSALSAADEIYAGAQRAKDINEYVKGLVNNKIFGGTALFAMLHNPTGAIPTSAAIAGGATAILGGMHTKEILSNILKNPFIRNEYASMMNAAAKENSKLVINHAKKLNKAIEKQADKPTSRYEILEEF